MTQDYFGRVATAMITPFNDDGSVNYTVAEKLAVHLVEQGSDAIVVCGTTGESPTLSETEKYELFRVVKGAIGDRAKVIAGTGSNSTSHAIEATQKAAKLGVDGTLQVAPYYNKPPQAGLYRHFQSIALACPELPVMLYNIPGRTGVSLQGETVAKLAEIDNIVAIKEASGSLDVASQIRACTPASFAIYSGEDALTLPLLAVGATGVVSVASHLAAAQLQEMCHAFATGQNSTALAIHLQLLPLFKALFSTTNPIPVKAALKLQGWDAGSVRSPLCELSPELHDILKQAMQQLSFL
ncbi:MAG: 4-hydroxy-tetrahydrodipicolinate synthase [Cyanobacteriota bacterium]|nr:4-hydroxy-tetrahydrodipicolinate synthase [Cyanobacteriota bacterium]